MLGGKVSAWQDEDGDWIETGLHIFFGAYPNMLNLFAVWPATASSGSSIAWCSRDPTRGRATAFEFPDGVPAPFNMALRSSNPTMLT